jgi:transposase
MTVLATKPDYDHLVDELYVIGRLIVVGFEATGNYHRTLAHRLFTSGFELQLISSVAHHQSQHRLGVGAASETGRP